MFQSLEDYTKELLDSADFTQKFVRKLLGGRTRVENAIAKAEKEVQAAKNETKYVASLKPQITKLGISAAKDILQANALQAIRENYEFDSPPYRNALFGAIEDDDTYLVRSRGSGFASVISIDINLDKTAGRLNFWGSAVKAARRDLGTKVPKKNSKKRESTALQASRAWAGIFEKRAGTFSKFARTIRLRLSYSPKPAPFWQLLDKGEIPLASDRGGYPTPKKTATNFVDQSEKAVNAYISNLLVKEKEKYEQLFSSYYFLLEDAQRNLQELDSLVDEIRLDYKQIQALDRKSDKLLKDTYITKLEKAVQLIREGLITSKRVQLATKGSFRGKRFSAETMKELLY